jgi:hypothetical protein
MRKKHRLDANLLHPTYEDRDVRAIFRPMETEQEPGIRQMIGHEFVWHFVGFEGKIPVWTPADPEDLDAYFEIVEVERPKCKSLLILETDLAIMRVEKLDA